MDITNTNDLKLRPGFKEQWIAALRSGEYAQTRGFLHVIVSVDEERKPGWCCLGVACDLIAKSGVDIVREEEVRGTGRVEHFDSGSMMPSLEIQDLMFAPTPYLTDLVRRAAISKLATELATANDSGRNFKYIAEWSEVNL